MHGVSEQTLGAIRGITDIYASLRDANYKRTSLETITSQWRTLRGFMQTLAETANPEDHAAQEVLEHAKRYIVNYDFDRELESLEGIYDKDPQRLRNIGLKVVESLEDKKLVEFYGDVLND